MMASKFKVRLRSQTDDQERFVTLTTGFEDEARAIVQDREMEYVSYSLEDDPHLTDEDRYRIGECRVDDDGKVRWSGAKPRARDRAKAHMDLQSEPYSIAEVERVALEQVQIGRLVDELARLSQDDEQWGSVLDGLRARGVPMAAVTGFMYGVPVKNQYDGTSVVDWDTDTIKVALLTGHTPNQDVHDFFNDVSGNQITGTGYTAGGATLGTKTATYDTASDQTRLDAADTTWTTSTLSATHAVVYKDTGTPTTSALMGLLDFGATVTTTAGTFQITWDATGIIVIDVT
jgi:hypothetical protein